LYACVADNADKLTPELLLPSPAVNYAGAFVTSDKLIAGVMESMKIQNKAWSLVSTTHAII
jgi:hypothetical protein